MLICYLWEQHFFRGSWCPLSWISIHLIFSASVIRSGHCSRHGKSYQEVIIFNVSENLLLKAMTVFLNHCAAGQAQVCCFLLHQSILRTWCCSLKVFGSPSTAFSSHPLFMPKKVHFPDVLSTPSKVFFQKFWVIFFFNSVHSSCIFKLMMHVSHSVLVCTHWQSISHVRSIMAGSIGRNKSSRGLQSTQGKDLHTE